MGRIRHEVIQELGLAEVVAFSDPTVAEKLVNDIPNLSVDAIINDPNIDVIVICTPNYLNKPLTIQGLRAGKHVFCEKPPAFTEKEVIEIKEVEMAHAGQKLMYGF